MNTEVALLLNALKTADAALRNHPGGDCRSEEDIREATCALATELETAQPRIVDNGGAAFPTVELAHRLDTPAMLPGFDASEADLVAYALSRPLSEKVDRAVALLRMHAPIAARMNDAGYWLAFSGGKDSQVIYALATMAGVQFRPVYNVTTIDPPELVQFIRREYSNVQFNRPRKALLTRMVEGGRGPPTRLARWCCEEYKEHGGTGWAKIIGVRISESANRARLWKETLANRRGSLILCPIAYWTDADVWRFHRALALPHCCLYDEGFRRIGCVGCPLAGPKAQAAEFARWPRFERNWKLAFERFWNRWHGVPTRAGKRRWFENFGSWQGLWDWWVSGKAASGGTGCQGEFLFDFGNDKDGEA